MTDLQLIVRVAAIIPFIVAIIFLYFIYYRYKRESEFRNKELLHQKVKAETELIALRSQMNPHFIFNSLQSIQQYIRKNENKLADEYLIKFSKLIRLILENSNKRTIALEDELDALSFYMELEALRFNPPFKYELLTEPGIRKEAVYIPPLLIQPFVENSIWHGIKNLDRDGIITINIKKQDSNINIKVIDNGRLSTDNYINVLKKESMGMKITMERIRLFNETNNKRASVLNKEILDDNNIHIGNTVEFNLPYDADE
jgi:LytS/YehU family sensor histidine kinase